MLNNFRHFSSRNYVLKNLSLEGQAGNLIKFYEYWGITYNEGFSEKCINVKKYSDSFTYQFYYYSKKILKRIIKQK